MQKSEPALRSSNLRHKATYAIPSIENDIEELLYNEQDSDDYIFSLGEEEEPLIISAVFHGTRQTLLCKTWVHKKWNQTKKFTKNHKKALIIGTVLVVVAVVTMDPAQPLPYLQRGIAHFGLGQYDRSLEDYREFVAQTQKTQQTLFLESVASIDAGANIADVIQASRSSLVLAEDLGFSTQEMAQLKQAGSLQSAVAEAIETISHDSNLLESVQRFKYAKEFLAPYQGKYISELEAKSLLSEAGMPTFPKPEGIPENYRIKLSDRGGGLKPEFTTEIHKILVISTSSTFT